MECVSAASISLAMANSVRMKKTARPPFCPPGKGIHDRKLIILSLVFQDITSKGLNFTLHQAGSERWAVTVFTSLFSVVYCAINMAFASPYTEAIRSFQQF